MFKTAVVLLLLAAPCFAQNPELTKAYKLDFIVKEVESSKLVNSRTYSTTMVVGQSRSSTIRSGSRVPVTTSNAGNQQTTFVEVGVNVDCRSLRDLGAQLEIDLSAEISSMPSEASPTFPVVRQNRWSSTVIVPAGKPVVLFASDDVASKRQIQLELLATPIK